MLHAFVELHYRPSDAWLDAQLSATLAPSSPPSSTPSPSSASSPTTEAAGAASISAALPQLQQQQQQQQGRHASPASLSDAVAILSSCTRLGYRPPEPAMRSLLETAFRRMDSASPAQLSALLSSLSKLRMVPPPAWMQRFWSSAWDSALHACSLGQLTQLLGAAARMERQHQSQQRRLMAAQAGPRVAAARGGGGGGASEPPREARAARGMRGGGGSGGPRLSAAAARRKEEERVWLVPKTWGAEALLVLERHLRSTPAPSLPPPRDLPSQQQQRRRQQRQGHVGEEEEKQKDMGSGARGAMREEEEEEQQQQREARRSARPPVPARQLLELSWALSHAPALRPPAALCARLLACSAASLPSLPPPKLSQLPVLLASAGCNRVHDRGGVFLQVLKLQGLRSMRKMTGRQVGVLLLSPSLSSPPLPS